MTQVSSALTDTLEGQRRLSIRNLINRHISPLTLLQIGTEVIAMSGYQCTALYQFTRWIDGSSHFSVGRRKGVGRGEGLSGLQFDIALRSRAGVMMSAEPPIDEQ